MWIIYLYSFIVAAVSFFNVVTFEFHQADDMAHQSVLFLQRDKQPMSLSAAKDN